MKTKILLRLPQHTKDDLKKVSEHEGMSINAFINSELRRVLDEKLQK
ncbi:Arc family DNA-binding protein [Staphylococcus xylosus]